MPAANIDRAIKKGTGELPGAVYDEIIYEGYGPGGAALLIETLTDNRNRTVSEIRHLLTKYGGSLGETGSVNWMFERKGSITVSSQVTTEDDLLELVLDHGAEDINLEEDVFDLVCDPEAVQSIKTVLEETGLEVLSAEVGMVPQSTVKIEGSHATSLLKLMELLDEHDDIQTVNSNFDIDEDILNSVE